MQIKVLDWVAWQAANIVCYLKTTVGAYVIYPPPHDPSGSADVTCVTWEASADNGMTRFHKGTLQSSLAACQSHYAEAQKRENKALAHETALKCCRQLMHYQREQMDRDLLVKAIRSAEEVHTLMGGINEI